MEKYYIYILLDTRKPGNYSYNNYSFDYEPFYVGKGCSNRVITHFYEKSLKIKSHKNNKIKNIIKETGNVPKYEIVLTTHNEEEAYKYETNFIKLIGRSDLKLGPLTNLTDGGDGTRGIIQTEQSNLKRSIAHQGKKHKDETKRRLSDIKTGKKLNLTKEQRINRSKIKQGENNPFYGKKHTEEALNKKRKPVHQIDPNTNEIIETYSSIKEAHEVTGISDVHIGNTCNKRKITAGGFKWQFTDHNFIKPIKSYDRSNYKISEEGLKNISSPVFQIDVDTNVIVAKYLSITEAANFTGCNRDKISATCIRRQKRSGGFKWRYVLPGEENIEIPPIDPSLLKAKDIGGIAKPVVQLDLITLEIINTFKSASEATKLTKIYSISEVCTGNRNKAGGYKWMYKEDYDKIVAELS